MGLRDEGVVEEDLCIKPVKTHETTAVGREESEVYKGRTARSDTRVERCKLQGRRFTICGG